MSVNHVDETELTRSASLWSSGYTSPCKHREGGREGGKERVSLPLFSAAQYYNHTTVVLSEQSKMLIFLRFLYYVFDC